MKKGSGKAGPLEGWTAVGLLSGVAAADQGSLEIRAAQMKPPTPSTTKTAV